MNMFTVSTGSNTHSNYKAKSVFAGNLPGLHNSISKSAQEKMERQQKAGNEIAFWEKQKENLKNMECGTVEEIAKKLETFHSYEDEIAAVKKAYNNEQMSHILDEAEEQGERNAKAAKKLEPKTPEERRKEMAEEALGTEEDKGVLEEFMDEMADSIEEVQEELQESQEQLLEEIPEEQAASMAEQLDKQAERIEENAEEMRNLQNLSQQNRRGKIYQGFDIRV